MEFIFKQKRQNSGDKPFEHGFEFKIDGGDILKWQIDEAIVMASKKNNVRYRHTIWSYTVLLSLYRAVLLHLLMPRLLELGKHEN